MRSFLALHSFSCCSSAEFHQNLDWNESLANRTIKVSSDKSKISESLWCRPWCQIKHVWQVWAVPTLQVILFLSHSPGLQDSCKVVHYSSGVVHYSSALIHYSSWDVHYSSKVVHYSSELSVPPLLWEDFIAALQDLLPCTVKKSSDQVILKYWFFLAII